MKSKFSDVFSGAIGLAFAAVVIGFSIFTLGAGWAGLEHAFGGWWGIAGVVLALVFRFTLPISVGVFFCARDIWHWHWAFSLLLAAPGLLLMIPGLVRSIIGAFRRAN